MAEALALVSMLLSFGDLPAAMGWTGEIAIGPAPYVFVPVGPVGIGFGGEAMPFVRVKALPGPTQIWIDCPPFRLGIGRSPGPALLALIWEPPRLVLSWELPFSGHISAFGGFGDETFLGIRFRYGQAWLGGVVEGGELSVWSGFYF